MNSPLHDCARRHVRPRDDRDARARGRQPDGGGPVVKVGCDGLADKPQQVVAGQVEGRHHL